MFRTEYIYRPEAVNRNRCSDIVVRDECEMAYEISVEMAPRALQCCGLAVATEAISVHYSH